MDKVFDANDDDRLREVVNRELDFVRSVGTDRNLILATSNQGAFEALLMLMLEHEEGLPVYRTLEQVRSRYASQSGIIKRLRVLREAGLIEARPGRKGSEVYLAPSREIIESLGPLLDQKFRKSEN
ncbi:winged helix-turn-helix domain-containing protein [Roseicyclus sp.]|uniref:winged helix-turn-helix domain-containing protein n=1 Tax=Roseicyclus sp. TaxID=1914329 RepID=UPI003F6CC864